MVHFYLLELLGVLIKIVACMERERERGKDTFDFFNVKHKINFIFFREET